MIRYRSSSFRGITCSRLRTGNAATQAKNRFASGIDAANHQDVVKIGARCIRSANTIFNSKFLPGIERRVVRRDVGVAGWRRIVARREDAISCILLENRPFLS